MDAATIPSGEGVGVDWLSAMECRLRDPATTADAFGEVVRRLADERSRQPLAGWVQTIQEFRQHSLLCTLHEDPFTERSYRRPRGYAGDAVLIDLIYGSGEGEPLVEKASELGKLMYRVGNAMPANQAARGRRDLLAATIDQACREKEAPHVLAVACGHLREAPLSVEFMAGRTGRFVALDQDRRSLRVAERALAGRGVEFLPASIGQLMDGSLQPGRFDLIYAAGLYDYLDEETGRRLTNVLAGMMRPGGRLLVANFMPQLPVSGYMEAAMDWWLIYRTEEQMARLARDLEGDLGVSTFRDSYDMLAYLDVRAGAGVRL